MAKAKRDNELRLIRTYRAPVELVWDAFTKVEHQEKWWGSRGFTITSESKNLIPKHQRNLSSFEQGIRYTPL